ncbi:MAG: PP2C family protein-serine/threonine phosphatase [Planctomycetota bacterium]
MGLVAREGGGHRLDDWESPDGVALVLADATGHGVGAALAVTQLQSMVRVAWRTQRSLMDVSRLVSERLFEVMPEGRFITAWMARLDLEAGWLEMYSAGQGPLFSVSVDGEVEVSAADGLPLGITPEISAVQPRRVSMGVGDLFVVISDGLIEAADEDGEQFGTERMGALIAAHRHESAERVAAVLRDEIGRFAPGVPSDDRTVLVVKRDG